ncbi:MAG: 4Fe-4S dicluster domain-containing protein [Deltaproteobacteria bacterium]|nr:4Fe-4S dicluster domain-containing protein [Deltaproteobacteria bacterium]
MPRVPYWNINYGLLIDALAIPMMAVFLYGLYRHWARIRQGKARIRLSGPNLPGKIGPVFVSALFFRGILGTRIYKKIYTGIAHGMLLWSMVVLLIGTTLTFLNVLFGLPVFSGNFNRWVMAFGLDAAGLAALIGLAFLLLHRLIPPDRLIQPAQRLGFTPIVGLLGLVILSGFFVEALRIAQTRIDAGAFVGNWLAGWVNGPFAMSLHQGFWWAHGLMALAFIAYLPFSPMVHMLLAPVNAALANPMPGPKMGVIDFASFDNETDDEMPTLGVAKLTDFTRKRLLDFDACLWCGRCHEVCPAAQTGKPLSPKGVITTLAQVLTTADRQDDSLADAVGVEAIFCCTTCAACMEACPVCINQPKSILKLRQNLVMERSEIPDLMGKANSSLEQRQHPFFGTSAGPRDWRKGLQVPVFEAGHTEYLLWIGCTATYEERAQKIARAMVRILEAAGVSYGILEQARCTGDPAKQMGNEFLFNEIARQNIQDFEALGIQKIITLCPHCYNSFTRHYKMLGTTYEVIPHSVLIETLIATGSLQINAGNQTICYHDPCYLGRRNNILDAPRQAVRAVGKLVEMPRHGRDSFCCGGGGGNYWAEEAGVRINQTRAQEALNTGADCIAVACPFCLLMLTDGCKKFTEEQKAFDIAELIAKQLKIN